MKRYKFTLIGLLLSIVLWLVIFIFDLDFFESFANMLLKFESFEFDELLISLIILVVFAHIDYYKKVRQTKIEAEKTKVYKAMLSANHHILNNFLNSMQIFKLTADQTPNFPDEVLVLYNQIIKTAKEQIEELSSINEVEETAIHEAIHNYSSKIHVP